MTTLTDKVAAHVALHDSDIDDMAHGRITLEVYRRLAESRSRALVEDGPEVIAAVTKFIEDRHRAEKKTWRKSGGFPVCFEDSPEGRHSK